MKFPVKSATYAMSGKELLSRKGIRASVGKTSGSDGCYYFLKVSDRERDAAQIILGENNILK